MTGSKLFLAAGLALALVIAGAFVLPDWALFLVTLATAKGLVSLGIVGMMRGGVVSFGQGLYYCLGAYVAAMLSGALGITDAVVILLAAMLLTGAIAAAIGPLLSGYRGIFFAMLTLSLSMVLYGTLAKMTIIGGTDGMNVASPTFLGWAPEGRELQSTLYLFVCVSAVALGTLMRIYFDSQRGLLSLAVRDNELRVEYLGASVKAAMTWNYVFAASLGVLRFVAFIFF